MRSGATSLLLVLALCFASVANAQDEEWAVVSEAQGQLNLEGIQAMKAGDYEKAIRLFRSALDLSELNVTYLNLGRALTRAGRCEEAVVAYEKVETSPKVKEPSPEVVKEKLAEYQIELNEMCPGQIAIKCTPGDMRVSIDNQAAVDCPTEILTVETGTHKIIGKAGASKVTVEVSVVAMETTDVHLELDVDGKISFKCDPPETRITIGDKKPVICPKKPVTLRAGTHQIKASHKDLSDKKDVVVVVNETVNVDFTLKPEVVVKVDPKKDPKKDPDQTTVTPPPVTSDPGTSGLAVTGWTLFGVGAASALTGIIIDFAVMGPLVDDMDTASKANDLSAFETAEDDFNTWQPINYGLIFGGAGLAVTGLILVVVDAASEPNAEVSFSPTWGPGQAGLQGTWRW